MNKLVLLLFAAVLLFGCTTQEGTNQASTFPTTLATITPAPTLSLTPTPSLTPSPTPTPTPSPVVYSSAKGFSGLQPAGWSVSEDDSAVVFIEPAETANIRLSVEANVAASLEEFTGVYKPQLANYSESIGFKEFRIEQESDRVVDGVQAHEIVYTGTLDGLKIRGEQVYLIKGEKIFFITSTASDSHFDAYHPVFEKTIESFKVQ